MITIPTLAQLYAANIAALEAEFTITIPVFGKSFLRGIAAVQAAKQKLQYLAIANTQKNIFVDTAESESVGGTLQRFGRVKLNRNPFPATAGQYQCAVSGSISAVIAAETTFKSDDDSTSPGKLFILDNAFTFVATTGNIVLRALEAGTDSKLVVGDTLTATIPIANVNATATVNSENVAPLAAEDLEVYRDKALAAYRLEPQGGAATDYRLWSYDAQGVQQVYPYAKSGAANEINLYVEATIADSTDGKGTPSQALLDAVEAVVEQDPDTTKPLNERGRRPLGVFEVHYLPVTPKNIDITIASYTGVDISAAVTAALELALSTKRPFIAGADILADRNDTFDTNNIIAIILNTKPGSVFGAITLTVAGVSVSTYTFTEGNIPYLNSVTFS